MHQQLKEKPQETEVISHLIILYFVYEQASTSLQFAFEFGKKVRAAPTSTKEAFDRSENIVTFGFEHIFKRKEKNIYISGVLWTCETDILRISSVSRLLSHNTT